MDPTSIGIVGCGFVADFYADTLPLHPELHLAAVTDRDPARAQAFARYHGVRCCGSLRQLLDDPEIDIVLNLTNPASHFEVSRAALLAGKHVYSEKPLAMDVQEAGVLVELALAQGRQLSAAPCSLLGETAQTVWQALRQQRIGRVRLVYAEMEDGLVHRMPYRRWRSASGAPWPYKDEFAVGSTIEHAGYYLSWLPAFFGPARQVTAFSACLVPDKLADAAAGDPGPDFSVACLRFASGVVARLTCSTVAPRDRSLRIIGDEGILQVPDCWDYRAPVYLRRRLTIRRRTVMCPWKWRCRLPRAAAGSIRIRHGHPMDFCRGVADLALAVREHRPPRLSARYCLHVTELALRISQALDKGASCRLSSSFEPALPMAWAQK